MSKKRFTDINIWDKEWFMELTPTHKCLLRYIFDRCDPTGCWKPNWRLASLHINDAVSFKDLESFPEEQYQLLENGKIFIPDFIPFQYGVLSKECRPHIPIIKLIEKNDLLEELGHLIENQGSSVKAIRKRLTYQFKKEIFEEDDYQCQYCSSRPGSSNIFIDHIIPLIEGGSNEPENLTTSCKSCNSKKHDDNVFEFIEKHNLKPLKNLLDKLDRVSKGSNTLKEEYIYKEQEEESKKGGAGGIGDVQKKAKMPISSDYGKLPDIKNSSAIEFVRIIKQVLITKKDVDDIWEVFKIQNLTGKKFYNDDSEVYGHFLNWIKTQNFNKAEKNGTKSNNSSNGKLGTSEARTSEFAKWINPS